MLGALSQDLRYGARMLRRSPGFTAVAVLALALGIGANSAIFSAVNAVLLRPLPYPDPGQLVQIKKEEALPAGMDLIGGGEFVGGLEFLEWRERNSVFSRIAAYSGSEASLTGVDEAERIVVGQVSADFFPLLGIQPALGRSFLPEEDRPGSHRVVILSHGIWQRRFGGDADVIGRTVTLNDESHTVVGVLPPTFQFPEPFEMWAPLALNESVERSGTQMSLVRVIARLKPGIALERARADLDAIARQARQGSREAAGDAPMHGDQSNAPSRTEAPPAARGDTLQQFNSELPAQGSEERMVAIPFPGPPGDRDPQGAARTTGDEGGPPRLLGGSGRLQVVTLREQLVANARLTLLVLLGAVAFLLLIACANVANLLLARAVTRKKEIAVRVALGASRGRVVRQLLTESVLLSLLGGLVGILLAVWGVGILQNSGVATLPHMQEIRIDGYVLGFTALISLVNGLVFGLAPALQASRHDVGEALKEGSYGSTGGLRRERLRSLLVVSEVALALVLLIGAGLMVKSFLRLQSVDPGFRPEGLLTMQITLSESRYGPQQQADFLKQLLQRLESLPGVQSVGATDHLPLTDYSLVTSVAIEGHPPPVFGKDPPASVASVSADYFRAMGIPLKRGRAFTDRDTKEAPGVVLVNEAFARRHFAGEDPIGRRISGGAAEGNWLTIVGVVGDVRQKGLDGEPEAEIYRPFSQGGSPLLSVVVRTAGDPMSLAAAARSQVRALDRDQPVHSMMTMQQRLADSMAPRRSSMLLLGIFAALALLLAAFGIYGVISYSVTQRTHEIGIRMALGAQREDVFRLIVGQGMILVSIGVAMGLAGAFAVTRVLSGLLYEVSVTDPAIFVGIALLLAGVALLASYIPARRAMKVDPLAALRYE